MLPTIDRSLTPLFVVRFPPDVSPEEIGLHFDELLTLVQASPATRIAIVVDLTRADILSPALRQHAVVKMRAIYPRAEGRIVGVAHVVASALTLGAITGILWLAPPPHPTLVTRSMDEAVAWARRRLDGTGPSIRI